MAVLSSRPDPVLGDAAANPLVRETVAMPAAIASAPTATNCRYGVGYLPDEPQSLSWIPTLGAGWYVNFSPFEPVEPSAEFVFTIRLRQLKSEGQRLPEYWIYPPLNYTYEEGGQQKPGLGYFLEQAPGRLWLVGNEIEINNDKQDNIMPDLYAQAYYDVYHYIKSVDPSAKVGIGSVTMATPGRLQYLDIVWDTYRDLFGVEPPVDVWNLHLYILPERTPSNVPMPADGNIAIGTDPALAIRSSGKSPANCPDPTLPDTTENDPRPDVYCKAEHDSVRIFREQILAIRGWMKDRGQQDKPLIISEYGSLFPFLNGQPDGSCEERLDEFGRCMYPERVTAYLRGTTDFMETTTDPELGYPEDGFRLVQRWLWYSIYTPYQVGGSSNLLRDDYAFFAPGSPDGLSTIGQAFRQQAIGQTSMSNLLAVDAFPVNLFVDQPGDRTTATLTATFRNSGTLSVVDPFAVTFYADAGLTRPIATATVNPYATGALPGCTWGGETASVSVEWPNLPVGTHAYWAVVDSTNEIGESVEVDNVTSRGEVTVRSLNDFAYGVRLPIVRGD
jgi:hypothetical protein